METAVKQTIVRHLENLKVQNSNKVIGYMMCLIDLQVKKPDEKTLKRTPLLSNKKQAG